MAEQRQAWLKLWIDGQPYEEALGRILKLEVDERADGASSFQISFDMAPIEGDWDLLADGRFALLHAITIELGVGPTNADEPTDTARVLQGYITAVEPRFGENRVPDTTLEVSGLDASCLMHFEERTKTWSGMTDSAIVSSIYQSYGFSTDVEDTPTTRSPERGPLVQRTTDAEFIRLLAKRNGFEAYVERSDAPVTPGAAPGQEVVGHFHAPRVGQASQPVLTLMPRETPSIIEMRARWESHRPATVIGSHIDEKTRRLSTSTFDKSRFPKLGAVSRADILKQRFAEVLPAMPTAASVTRQSSDVPWGAAEAESMAWADFQQADWLAEAEGTVHGLRYEKILRARRPVDIAGAGKLLDGTWYARGVSHRWNRGEQTKRYEVGVDLVRNALGAIG
jgi:hypothetical protein